MYSKVLHSKAFLPTLFEIMGWSPECRYRVNGYLLSLKSCDALVFDLPLSTQLIHAEEIPEESSDLSLNYNGSYISVLPASEINSFENFSITFSHSAIENKEKQKNISRASLPHTSDKNVDKKLSQLKARFSL